MIRKNRRIRRGYSFNSRPQGTPIENLQNLVGTLQQRLPSLGVSDGWERNCWKLSSTLFALKGKHNINVTLNFSMPPALGGAELTGQWADVAKALFVSREREKHKSVTSHRAFVAVVGSVAKAAHYHSVEGLTPAILDEACAEITQNSSPSESYKRHNMVAEFARRCTEKGLCHIDLKGYRYYGLNRPPNYGGESGRKLDDLRLTSEHPDRILVEQTFQVLGELFRNVPRDHKYRVYLRIITLLVCFGRRLSEVALLPRQKLQKKATGYCFYYLQSKGVDGSRQYSLRHISLMSEVVPLVEAVLEELEECSAELYSVAEEMCRTQGPDLRFLSHIRDDEHLTYSTLRDLGFPTSILLPSGWLHKNGRIREALLFRNHTRSGYVVKSDVEDYCRSHYHARMTECLYTVSGKDYYLKDMLILKYQGSSSGYYHSWLVDTCSHSSFTSFLRYLELLVEQYASSRLSQKFTSHDFRHTMNHALERGGLPELMQTEFFGRKNPRDNKAYHHTSPELRALEIREKIKLGEIGGEVADHAMRLPVDKREAYIINKVRAVHDLGLGMCFRRWQEGPCERHMQCDTGCGLLGWMKNPEDKESVFEELMRQAAQHLLSVEIAAGIYQDPNDISSWEKQNFIKIYNILDRAEALKPGVSVQDVYDYINNGGLDELAAQQRKDAVGRGYELYMARREKFYEQCVKYEREYSEMFDVLRVIPPYVEVKGG